MQTAPRTAHPGLVALVLSVVLAPVGLVLGIVSLARARRSAEPRPLLGFLATIIGSAGSLCLTVLIVGIVLVSGSIGDSQRAAAMCQRAAADPTLTTDLLAVVTPLNDLSAPFIPGHGPSAEAKKAVVDQIPPLTTRIDAILLSSGHGYASVFDSGYNAYEFLNNAAKALGPDAASVASLNSGAGGTLKSLVSKYSDDLSLQCAGR